MQKPDLIFFDLNCINSECQKRVYSSDRINQLFKAFRLISVLSYVQIDKSRTLLDTLR